MIKFYRVENTGWSNGVSWFGDDNRMEKGEAFMRAINSKEEYNDPDMLWRVVEVHIHQYPDGKVTVERYHVV